MTRCRPPTRAAPACRSRSPRLRGWDYRWSAESVPQTLGDVWGDELQGSARCAGRRARQQGHDAPRARHDRRRRSSTRSARRSTELQRDFGRWQVPWGEINRFQRISADDRPAVQRRRRRASRCRSPTANWGSLASFDARPKPGTKRWYGDLRQQLRRGGRVRPAGPRPRGHRRRRERPSRHRRTSTTGAALCVRRSARRSISIPTSSRATPSGSTARASKLTSPGELVRRADQRRRGCPAR